MTRCWFHTLMNTPCSSPSSRDSLGSKSSGIQDQELETDLPETMLYPISPVDSRLSRPGYLAGHSLAGDFPVKAGDNGNVPRPLHRA